MRFNAATLLSVLPTLWPCASARPSSSTRGTLQPRSASTGPYACSASSIPNPELFGAEITSLTAHEVHNYSTTGEAYAAGGVARNYTGLEFCQVNITYTHPGANDSVHVQVWLPLSGWNQRFLGTGGGGFTTGTMAPALAPAIANGYSAASTDGGHGIGVSASTWALLSLGNVDLHLLVDFASRSLHDMTVLGKAVTESFYGTAPQYSYWNGCSTGGRQGLMEAQRYANDYDGILATAPAINWHKFVTAEIWPQVVMHELGVYPDQCEFNAITAAAIEACDPLDGVTDSIIAATGLCNFDPHTLVGQPFTCDTDGTQRTYSSAAATIALETWNGAHTDNGTRLWYGLAPGSPLNGLANTNRTSNGTSYGVPFVISDEWIRLFVVKDPAFSTTNLTTAAFESIFRQSVQEYASIIGTDDPDLSAFRDAGGKMITWHGLADPLIPPNGTVDYYDRVVATDPEVMDYYRVFLAPGVGHCSGGPGPYPENALGALVDWVEQGVAPEELAATSPAVNGTVARRPLCPYPLVARWDGVGDWTEASSYECAASFV
ncbi:hypothetical protein W97_07897 [Coniosporium apollinis CBS 100218]|uniref:Carboxylic ester hydrolase n=1 Tax=Coniosporium apollinis (strain CBS 100218) TaxID=1168221 RepID=R7Z3Q5_CONA1|nr:uncharacterized protein W97_07897 [Coniosporium apollinis CBS 100218]EON68639.1 hypothetical protein W97_07897 [Coniosporium apollinis CBS 100218]